MISSTSQFTTRRTTWSSSAATAKRIIVTTVAMLFALQVVMVRSFQFYPVTKNNVVFLKSSSCSNLLGLGRNGFQKKTTIGMSKLSMMSSSSSSSSSTSSTNKKKNKGKILVLGGTGFLGQTICRRANVEGYSVTSLSRRGLPPADTTTTTASGVNIDYRKGDARQKESISNILDEGGYIAIIHCIGLLFDEASGLGNFNRFASGSASIIDSDATYDTITRLTSFNAIDTAISHWTTTTSDNSDTSSSSPSSLPFIFISAAEAGWPTMKYGKQVETYLAPDWLKRYLEAKRAVEAKLLASQPTLRPIIFRPSLIFSFDRLGSYPAVGAFFLGSKIGLPFIDRPVTVQALANAAVRSIGRKEVVGIQRYKQVDELNK